MIKRPRDSNQLAKLLVDIATGQIEDKAAPAKAGLTGKVTTRKKKPKIGKPANQKTKPKKTKKQG